VIRERVIGGTGPLGAAGSLSGWLRPGPVRDVAEIGGMEEALWRALHVRR
jgi:hypothetical protein